MTPLSVALLWHLHQPAYRLRGERSCLLPWTRLHAIRSYYDLARILDEFPEVRVTVNLVPSLLAQIRAYEEGATDRFWEIGAAPAEDLDEPRMAFLLDHFFSAHKEQMIDALPRFAGLYERRQQARRLRGPAEAWKEFSPADYRDLQALFDLSWFGFAARRDFPEIRALEQQGRSYTAADLEHIHAIEREILGRILPLYRAAAARGQIEIATSPWAHPILPLLIDTDAALEAMPGAALPERLRAPEDARAQVLEALGYIERVIGVRPRGVWPSEGAISQATVEMLSDLGLAWAASDEAVLDASERAGSFDPCRPWEPAGREGGLALVFRDHDLSDRIGFAYATRPPAEAAADFVATALDRAGGVDARGDGGRGDVADHHGAGGDEGPGSRLLLIALDGENPWENYPRAGADFLRALYRSLSTTAGLKCRTVSEAIAACPRRGAVRRVRAGSWIRADLSTWIGGPEKNRAWTLLGRARSQLLPAMQQSRDPEAARAAWESLRAAEGSDWFWWLDGQFSTLYRAQFDQIFRSHLRQAYDTLDLPVPDVLNWPIPATPRPVGEEALADPARPLAPEIDGYENDFFEWRGAVRLAWNRLGEAGTMQRARRPVAALWFAFSAAGEFLLRLDPDTAAVRPAFSPCGLDLSFRVGERVHMLSIDLDTAGDMSGARIARGEPGAQPGGRFAFEAETTRVRARARKILELCVPLEEVGLTAGERGALLVRLRCPEGELPLREIDFRIPARGGPAPGAS